jgi:acetyl-CoA acetyltransferase
MTRSSPRLPTIVGTGLSDCGRAPHLDTAQHHSLAAARALADCGLSFKDVDGYMSTNTGGGLNTGYDDPTVMAEYLGLRPRWTDGTMIGGATFELFVQHAAAAIRDGAAEVVLITYGSDVLSRAGRKLGSLGAGRTGTSGVAGPAQYEAPFGNTLIGAYAMAAQRHMHEYGTTAEQLARIATAAREFAAWNPTALYRDPMTVDDVLASRLVADPLHKLDCCVVSDGGGAVVITTAERAADLAQPPVFVLGAAAAQSHWHISQMPDFTRTAAVECGREAFAQAGLRPGDVDTAQIYDSFTITALVLLEDLGFCAKGEGGAFVESGAIRPGGSLPMNTDGGGLSSCHPGMRGIFLLVEAVRQLRGHAGEAQVPDCEVAVACGSGAWLSCMGAVVLGTAPS